jgi:uncharacterized protein (DUF2249 family)
VACPELQALAGYLHAEVLRQASDQEWLFPAHQAGEGLAQLARDRVRLRGDTEILTQAAFEGTGSRAELAAATHDLLAHLERHFAAEERLLTTVGAPGTAPAITAAGRRHEWYPVTEGPVIDLDMLPSAQLADAVVDRLLRLRSGGQVALLCDRDPVRVRRMDGLLPGWYGLKYLQDGPELAGTGHPADRGMRVFRAGSQLAAGVSVVQSGSRRERAARRGR